VLIFLSLTT